jgi:tetratricopeptide (TPR) repeat protein
VAYTSEIDKLEARFRDNPKGRNFAPLADAYRKAGLIDNAIDLCQNGLQLHPDYVSAHIVYARCLIDKKDDTAAQGVFKKVLELDRENIIALRALAELADRNGRFEDERGRRRVAGARQREGCHQAGGSSRHHADAQAGFRGRTRDSGVGRAHEAVQSFGLRTRNREL